MILFDSRKHVREQLDDAEEFDTTEPAYELYEYLWGLAGVVRIRDKYILFDKEAV